MKVMLIHLDSRQSLLQSRESLLVEVVDALLSIAGLLEHMVGGLLTGAL